MKCPPVLVTAYNRPELLGTLFSTLANQGVTHVWLHVDGPLPYNHEAHSKIVAIAQNAWPFALKLKCATTHLGCRKGMEAAISWFFNEVEEGIILEDDCLPLPGFLEFCQRQLQGYKHRDDVFMVSGHLPVGQWHNGSDHALAATGQIWGWATWRRAWRKHEARLESNSPIVEAHFTQRLGHTAMAKELLANTHASVEGKLDTWDYLWMHTVYVNHGLCVMPTQNLTLNHGFGAHATHTPIEPDWHKNLRSLNLPSVLPPGPPAHGRDRELEYLIYTTVRGYVRQPFVVPTNGAGLSEKWLSGRKTIVQIGFTDGGGGAERVMMEHHRQLEALGHDAWVFVARLKHRGERIRLLATQRRKNSLWPFDHEHSVVRSLKEFGLKPDLVHLHNLHGINLNFDDLIELSSNVPVIWTLHDMWVLQQYDKHPYHNENLSLDRLKRTPKGQLILDGKSALVAPSVWLAEQVARVYRKPVRVIPNGVDTAIFRPSSTIEKNGLLAVMNHAQRNPYREFRLLVEAWEMLNNSELNAPIDLVVVGGEPEQRTHRSAKLNVVPFIQNREQLADLMRQCRVFVHPSITDTYGLSLAEALACGASCVTSDVAALPELPHAPGQWRFYTSGNVQSLVGALREALSASTQTLSSQANSLNQVTRCYLGLAQTLSQSA